RELDRDLKRAKIPKHVPGLGKVDFHACRVAYTTFVIEAGANVKEAQVLLRHSTPQLTLDVYARERPENLGRLADTVGEFLHAPGHSAAPTEPPLADVSGGGSLVSVGPSVTCDNEEWWRRGESNPRPATNPRGLLQE